MIKEAAKRLMASKWVLNWDLDSDRIWYLPYSKNTTFHRSLVFNSDHIYAFPRGMIFYADPDFIVKIGELMGPQK